jgi:hypothetical protein
MTEVGGTIPLFATGGYHGRAGMVPAPLDRTLKISIPSGDPVNTFLTLSPRTVTSSQRLQLGKRPRPPCCMQWTRPARLERPIAFRLALQTIPPNSRAH